MDTKTVQYLWALKKVNDALIEGLKTAIFVLEKEDDLSNKRRKSMIESLKHLISQSEEIYAAAQPNINNSSQPPRLHTPLNLAVGFMINTGFFLTRKFCIIYL